MTVRTYALAPTGENRNAEDLRQKILETEPSLHHPDITLDIVSGVYLPRREIDLIVLYQDKRSDDLLLRTKGGCPIHSFVLIIEVKNHSPDNIRFRGANLEVCYGGRWSNATHQCNQQIYAFKEFQSAPLGRNRKLAPVFVQKAIWLTRTPRRSLPPVEPGNVPILYQETGWSDLTSHLVVRKIGPTRRVQTFLASGENYHTFETLKKKLTHKVVPTKLDLEKIDILNRKRFGDQKYIQNLGNQLLVFRGRGGTGKTVTLIQFALYLARQNKTCVFLSYNHCLLSEISRHLHLAAQRDRSLKTRPHVQTRYSFIQDVFVRECGQDEEAKIRQQSRKITDSEDARLERLMRIDSLDSEFDFALIDEGQDWHPRQRDLIYRMFGADRVVVADGIDQFVGKDRCRWDLKGNDQETIPKNSRQIVSLKSSLRTKGATCQIVGAIAEELNVNGWDLQPHPEVSGGRFTVFVEPDSRSAMNVCLDLIDKDMEQSSHAPSDNLICMPSYKQGGRNFVQVFDQAIEESQRKSWRGFDEHDRRQPIHDLQQIKAVLYNSCRGLEGWTAACLGLDTFYDFQINNPRIDREDLKHELLERDGLFAEGNIEEEFARRTKEFAANWLMIPLTRSIDHLIVHIADENSRLMHVLKTVSAQNPGAVEWLCSDGPKEGYD